MNTGTARDNRQRTGGKVMYGRHGDYCRTAHKEAAPKDDTEEEIMQAEEALREAMVANRRAAAIPDLPGHVSAAFLSAGTLAQSSLSRRRLGVASPLDAPPATHDDGETQTTVVDISQGMRGEGTT